jgi:hypothetical protein
MTSHPPTARDWKKNGKTIKMNVDVDTQSNEENLAVATKKNLSQKTLQGVWVWTKHTQANTERQTNNKDTDRKYRIGSATKKQKKRFCKDKRTTEKRADSPRFARNMLVRPPQNN